MSKVVRNGIYKTKKTHVIISKNHVTKTFLHSKDYKRRFKREAKALSFMSSLNFVPKLVHLDNENFSLRMKRLEGNTPSSLSLNNIKQLRNIVQGMIQCGVARHAIPIRDLLVSENDQLGMVDFERISLRTWTYSPFWQVACIVTKYHMCRLIWTYHPKCLSKNERVFLQFIHSIRTALKPLKMVKDTIRRTFF